MPYSNRYNSDVSTSSYGRLNLQPLTLARNDNTFRDVINTLNEQQFKVNEIRGAITQAFNNAKLHHDEDAYKQHRIDYYTNELMKNPFDFVRAQQLANEAANDAEFKAKIRTNEEYEEFRGVVEKYRDQGAIDDITAERLLKEESNQYKFTPTYDEYGKIVGGKRWVAGKMPVKKVDRSKLAQFAAQIARPKKGRTSGETQSSVVNADGTGSGSMSFSSKEFERLDAATIQEVFDGVFAAMPDAQDALMQDYEDDLYRIDKANKALLTELDPGRQHVLQAEIDMTKERLYDENGILRSPKAYMAYAMDMIIPNMAYDWNYIDTKSHSRVDRQASGSGAGVGSQGLGLLQGIMGRDFDKFINGTTIGGNVLGLVTDHTNKAVDVALGLSNFISMLFGYSGGVESKVRN